ncbi:tRNA pseudouridine(55) synthase TruB, partial [Lactobacillus acetotolerans]
IELMHTKPKEYTGTGLFGYSTDSYDTDGKVLQEKKLTQPITAEQIKAAMKNFEGKIEQVPPIYSAVKVNGKRLYDYARAGIKVERPKRQVDIFSYKLVNAPRYDQGKVQESFDFVIKCSKGTYIRSLVNDLGVKLGVPAVMTNLRRTASSGFNIDQAVKLNEITTNPDEAAKLIQPIDNFFKDYPTIDLSSGVWMKVKNGVSVPLASDAKKVALRYNNKVKAIYQKQGEVYRPDLMLLQNE